MRFRLTSILLVLLAVPACSRVDSAIADGGASDSTPGDAAADASADQESADGGGDQDGAGASDAGSGDGSSSDGSSGDAVASCSGPVLQGSFVIHNTLDLAAIQPYAEITGDLDFDAAGLSTISLPNLCRVGGGIGTHSQQLTGCTTFDAPKLQSAMEISLTGMSVSTLAFPALTTAPREVFLTSTTPVAVSMPLLTTTGSLYVQGVASLDFRSLESVVELIVSPPGAPQFTRFDALVTVGKINFVGSVQINTGGAWSFPVLRSVVGGTGDLEVVGPVTSFDAPLLAVVGGHVWFDRTTLSTLQLPALQSVGSIRLGANSYAQCSISGNANLSSVKMPSLNHVGGAIFVSGAIPMLPQACLDALFTQTGVMAPPACPGSLGCSCPGISGPCL